MKIYIWEGDGISSGYHDDGTLVVLAESPAQAREMVRRERAEQQKLVTDWQARVEQFARDNGYGWGPRVSGKPGMNQDPRFKEATGLAWYEDPRYGKEWDGSDAALDREPDRVIELDKPCVVAFNGGGYD